MLLRHGECEWLAVVDGDLDAVLDIDLFPFCLSSVLLSLKVFVPPLH